MYENCAYEFTIIFLFYFDNFDVQDWEAPAQQSRRN